jgi:archaellum biogenesis protein FlaJ (TadC family)
LLSRSLSIIKESLRTGGEIAVVLEKTAEESREANIAKKEIRAQLLIYVIFLSFAAVLGVPVLLAVSVKMVATLQQSFALSAPTADISNVVGFTISKPPFTDREFNWFALITIFLTTFIASFMISVAYTGTKKQAFRFFPFMVLVSYVAYFFAITGVEILLGSIV